MNMNIQLVVTPPYIYYGCLTRKTFWKEIFTLCDFTPVNMENCGRRNVRKHREIKNDEKHITFDIWLNFGILNKMKITYLQPKDYFKISGKGLITSLGIKTIVQPKKGKKSRCVITNVSMNFISKIIKTFENLPYKGYVRKRPKHEPTDSNFCLVGKLSKCMMISDAFNMHVDPVITKITGMQQILISHVFDLY